MSILKRRPSRAAESADGGRRSFFWKLGAGVSAAMASTAGLARGGVDTADGHSDSIELALRKLHEAYERALDKGLHDEVIGMFTEDAEVVFNGEAFRHRPAITALYGERFPSGKIGKRMEPAPGFEVDAGQQQEIVEVAADGLSAKAIFPFSIQVGMPLESETSLTSMARLHGEGVRTWWEGGVYEVSYAKRTDGRWSMRRLEYRTLSRADYRPGRSYAKALSA